MKSAERRVVILDVLRGVAVLLVLARHMSPPDAGVASPLKAAGALGIQVGWIGVDLFFVLSGFLVSGLLFTEYLRHGSIDIVRFLVRRGFKIYPGFYVFIALTTVLLLVKGRFDASMAAALIAEVFYVQNYFGGMWNHTWSLAIEEHFYILLAVTLFLFVRTKPDLSTHERLRRFSTVVIVTGIMVAAGRALMPYVMLYTGGTQLDGTQLRIETHARIDTLAVGVLLSYLYHFHREKFMDTARAYRVPILGTSALLLTPPFVWPLGESHFTPSVGLVSIALGFGAILVTVLAASQPMRRIHPLAHAATQTLGFVGFHSYSIYLWHMPVQVFFMGFLRAEGVGTAASPTAAFVIESCAYMITSILIGVFMGRLVERPALAVRERLFPSRAGGLISSEKRSHESRAWDPIAPPGR